MTRVYGEQPAVAALRGVSFSVRRGELVAIVRPSGSGKSTLLHVMGTLERSSGGVVRIGGVDAARLSDSELSLLRAPEIGFFLAEHATARENVADGLLYAGVPVAERYRRADEALERVGLSERATASPNARTSSPPSSPEGSGSGWRSPGPSSSVRRSCSPTTDREPRRHHRRIDHGAHARAQRRRRDHHHDHPRRGSR